MMLRILLLVALASVVCRWALGQWPWDYLRGPSTRQQAALRARKLLGVEAGANRDDVIAAHRRLCIPIAAAPRRRCKRLMPRAICCWLICQAHRLGPVMMMVRGRRKVDTSGGRALVRRVSCGGNDWALRSVKG